MRTRRETRTTTSRGDRRIVKKKKKKKKRNPRICNTHIRIRITVINYNKIIESFMMIYYELRIQVTLYAIMYFKKFFINGKINRNNYDHQTI